MRARPPQPPLPGATAVTDDELGAVLERFAATFVLRARRERPRLLADPRRRDVELGAVSAWIDRSLASELRDRVPPALRGTPGILLLRGRAPGRVHLGAAACICDDGLFLADTSAHALVIYDVGPPTLLTAPSRR